MAQLTQLSQLLQEYGLPESAPLSVIGPGLRIDGNVRVDEGASLVVFGRVEGDIVSDGTVVVGREASVLGGLQAARIAVHGIVDASPVRDGERVHGVRTTGPLHVACGGRLTAEVIAYGSLQAERGSRIQGSLEPVDTELDPSLTAEPPAALPRLEVPPGRAAAAQPQIAAAHRQPLAAAPRLEALQPLAPPPASTVVSWNPSVPRATAPAAPANPVEFQPTETGALTRAS